MVVCHNCFCGNMFVACRINYPVIESHIAKRWPNIVVEANYDTPVNIFKF